MCWRFEPCAAHNCSQNYINAVTNFGSPDHFPTLPLVIHNLSNMPVPKENRRTSPLGVRPLEDGGSFTLPSTTCSPRRLEFVRRGNIMLGFYTTVAIVSKTGQDVITPSNFWKRSLTFATGSSIRVDPSTRCLWSLILKPDHLMETKSRYCLVSLCLCNYSFPILPT